MKHSLHRFALPKQRKLFAPLLLLAVLLAGCRKNHDLPFVTVATLASGLEAPMGVETDWKGNVWVAEAGTTKNDGKVVVVAPAFDKSGGAMTVSDAIINLPAIANTLSGEPEGPANLILDNDILYILAADFLYSIDVSSFSPGDEPIDASKLPHEDIGSWVRSQNIVTPNDSHPYNLIKGPDGYIYIVDAGANAIIKRKAADDYVVFAKFPDLPNPTSTGPPVIQNVPTGIIFDGSNFLVSTLTGFPFLEKQAVIYKVTTSGEVSIYQNNLTTLTGIARGGSDSHVALSFGTFGATGFNANTGSLQFVDGTSARLITGGLNMPAGIKQITRRRWFVTSMGDGTLLEISYGGIN
jgi:hypothetical protein